MPFDARWHRHLKVKEPTQFAIELGDALQASGEVLQIALIGAGVVALAGLSLYVNLSSDTDDRFRRTSR